MTTKEKFVRVNQDVRDRVRRLGIDLGMAQGDVIEMGIEWIESERRLGDIIEASLDPEATEEAGALIKDLRELQIDLRCFLSDYRENRSQRAIAERERALREAEERERERREEEARRTESAARRKARVRNKRKRS